MRKKLIFMIIVFLMFTSVQAEAKVNINKKKMIISKGTSFTLQLKGAKKTTFKSSNKKIATVKKKGKNSVKVIGKKKGTAKITTQYKKKKFRCSVVVEDPKISTKNISMKKGTSQVVYVRGTARKPFWSVFNPSVISLKANGQKAVITANKAGKTTIEARLSDRKYTVSVTVSEVKQKPASRTSQTKEDVTRTKDPTSGTNHATVTGTPANLQESELIKEESLQHYFKVYKGTVYDMVTGKPLPEMTVDGEYFTGDNKTKYPISAEFNQTIEAVVDYDDSMEGKKGVFDAFDNTNGEDWPISTLGLSYQNKTYSLSVNRNAPNPYNSHYANINTSYLRNDGFYVYQDCPKGDCFVAESGDFTNRHAYIMINGTTTDYDMDKSLPWYHRDCIRKIRFTNYHKVKYIKIYKGARDKASIEKDFKETGISPQEIKYASDGIAGLGSPLAFTMENDHVVWQNPGEKAGIYQIGDKKYGVAEYETDNHADNSKYESIHIINKRETMMKGKQYSLTAYPYPFSISGANGVDDYDVEWSSSNPDVVFALEGLLIAKKTGTAVITARLKGTDISDNFTITVTEPMPEHTKVYNVPEDFVSEKGDSFSDTDYKMTMRAIYAAIDQAKADGYDHVIFPKRKFYASVFTDARFMYYVPSEMTIEFPEGSELHMMYEESMSRNNEFHVFEFGVRGGDYENHCVNSHLIINDYYGERYEDAQAGQLDERKFIEEVRFAEFGRKALNCSVEIRNAYYPTGYFITGDGTSSDPNKTDGVIRYNNLTQGRYDENGVLYNDSNWISTPDFITIPQKIKKDGFFLSSAGHNSYDGKYWNGTSSRLYDILWFDENKNLIQDDKWHGITEFYSIPDNAAFFKVSLQRGDIPTSDNPDSAWLAMHDNGAAKDCEIRNTSTYHTATGMFSIVGETDGLYIHDNYIPSDGMKKYDERSGDLENGWQTMRHSVITHNVFGGHFGSGGHNTFLHTNYLGEECYTRPDDEWTRIINNRCLAFICSEKIQLKYTYNQTRTTIWNTLKGWECIGKLHKKYIKGI